MDDDWGYPHDLGKLHMDILSYNPAMNPRHPIRATKSTTERIKMPLPWWAGNFSAIFVVMSEATNQGFNIDQNGLVGKSYWKLPFIVDLPIKYGISPGWWVTYPSEKWWSERQLGWWHSQYMESHKTHVHNHQPVYDDCRQNMSNLFGFHAGLRGTFWWQAMWRWQAAKIYDLPEAFDRTLDFYTVAASATESSISLKKQRTGAKSLKPMLKNKLWTSCGTGKASCNSVSSHETFKKYIKLVNKPSQWSVSVKFLLSHWKISTLQKQQTRRDTSHAHQAARANFDSHLSICPSIYLSISPPTYLSTHPPIHPSIHPFIHQSKSIYIYLNLSTSI